MKSADFGHGKNSVVHSAACFHLSSSGRSLVQSEMRPVVVVVVDIFFHQPVHMASVQHNDMIEQVLPVVSNPALGNAVLPRTAETGSLWLDT